jgi:hypothetical protein
MWEPKTAAEIEEAAKRGDLEETPTFDAKADLPATAKKNVTAAIDVAAMSTAGGTLVYGVGEDGDGRPTIPQPIALAGKSDRLSQIVSTSISEVPYIDVRELATDDDRSLGYLLVLIPASPRAPHQVTVRGEFRYYGRDAKGNRILTEAEVARLYERRRSWEVNRGGRLAEVVQTTPFPIEAGAGYVYAFAQPVPPDRELWEQAVQTAGGEPGLQDQLAQAAKQPGPPARWDATFKQLPHWHQQGADAWRLSNSSNREPDANFTKYLADITVNIDGRGVLFSGGAGQTIARNPSFPDDSQLIIFEAAIAGNLAAFLSFMGALFKAAGYLGPVDAGVYITGLNGGISAAVVSRRQVVFFDDMPTYNAAIYTRTERLASAAELDAPEAVALRLLRRLLDTTTQQPGYNPFEPQ